MNIDPFTRKKLSKLARLFKEEAAQMAADKGQHDLAKKIRRKRLDWDAIADIVFEEEKPLVLTGIAL